jgi:hypothetical protein
MYDATASVVKRHEAAPWLLGTKAKIERLRFGSIAPAVRRVTGDDKFMR